MMAIECQLEPEVHKLLLDRCASARHRSSEWILVVQCVEMTAIHKIQQAVRLSEVSGK